MEVVAEVAESEAPPPDVAGSEELVGACSAGKSALPLPPEVDVASDVKEFGDQAFIAFGEHDFFNFFQLGPEFVEYGFVIVDELIEHRVSESVRSARDETRGFGTTIEHGLDGAE